MVATYGNLSTRNGGYVLLGTNAQLVWPRINTNTARTKAGKINNVNKSIFFLPTKIMFFHIRSFSFVASLAIAILKAIHFFLKSNVYTIPIFN